MSPAAALLERVCLSPLPGVAWPQLELQHAVAVLVVWAEPGSATSGLECNHSTVQFGVVGGDVEAAESSTIPSRDIL